MNTLKEHGVVVFGKAPASEYRPIKHTQVRGRVPASPWHSLRKKLGLKYKYVYKVVGGYLEI
jgi:hypothetical protein